MPTAILLGAIDVFTGFMTGLLRGRRLAIDARTLLLAGATTVGMRVKPVV